MKVEWDFHFETKGFRFEREYKYIATNNTPTKYNGEILENCQFEIRITPNPKPPRNGADQKGKLFITVPFDGEDSKDVAIFIAQVIAEKISFEYGCFKPSYSFLLSKMIPETGEEIDKVGDRPYSFEMSMVEVTDSIKRFDSAFTFDSVEPEQLRLMAVFNETKQDESPIRQFLGYFRIIEGIYSDRRKKKALKDILLNKQDLKNIFIRHFPEGDFERFIIHIVSTRHKCAHLKVENNFGYSPIDQEVSNEVIPYLEVLEVLAKSSIHHAAG